MENTGGLTPPVAFRGCGLAECRLYKRIACYFG